MVSCSTLWNQFLKQSESTYLLNTFLAQFLKTFLQGVCWAYIYIYVWKHFYPLSLQHVSRTYYWLGTFLKTGFSNSPRQHGSWKRFTTSSFNTPLNTCHEHVHRTCENVSWKRLLKRCQYWTRFLKSYLERSWTCIAVFLDMLLEKTFWTEIFNFLQTCSSTWLGHNFGNTFSWTHFLNMLLGHQPRTSPQLEH